jgi:DMSO reductase family type II enzyme chaperone
MDTPQKPAAVDCSVIRSNLYKLLSIGFHYPIPTVFETFQNGKFLEKLWNNISYLPHLNALMSEQAVMCRKVQKDLKGVTFANFEMKFVQTFDAGVPLPPCPLYEGIYRSEPRTAILLEVSEFYRLFGLRTTREFSDHLCVELEFLHFLTSNELWSSRYLLQGYLLAQKDFLQRHLIRWFPEFCNKLGGSIFLYPELARITSMFITCELEHTSSKLDDLQN